MDLKTIFALLTMLSCQFKRSLETLNLGSHMEISKSFTIILQRLRYVYPNLLIVPHIFFRRLFLHKKGDLRSQISWHFLIHHELSDKQFLDAIASLESLEFLFLMVGLTVYAGGKIYTLRRRLSCTMSIKVFYLDSILQKLECRTSFFFAS